MILGEEVTWSKRMRNDQNRNKPTRYVTGVIIGERMNKNREFEIAVRWYSGNLPDQPKSIMWVKETEILYGKCSVAKHVSKIAPMALERRRLKAQQTQMESKAAAIIWKMNCELNDTKKAA